MRKRKQYSRGRKPTPQARFVSNERARSPDTEKLVKDVLAQLSCDRHEKRNMCNRPPTTGPQQV